MTSAEAAALRRRLLRLAGLLAVALVAVLVNAVLNGGGDSGPANPIRAAALRTEREPGGHAAVEVVISDGGQKSLVATGNAVFDLRSGRSHATLTGPAGQAGTETIDAYASRDASFVSSPGYRLLLPPGMHWLSSEPWLGGSEVTGLIGRWNPADQVRMMRVAGEVEDLGKQKVLGVTTELYGGRVDLRDYAAILRSEGDRRGAAEFRHLAVLVPTPVRVEAWVGADGTLGRVRIVTTLPSIHAGETEIVDSRAEFMNFGAVTVPRQPRATGTLDISPLLRWQDHLQAPRSIAPAAGSPLSAGGFHRRAAAICTKFEAFGKRQTALAKPAGEALRRLGEERVPGRAGAERVLNAYKRYLTNYFAPLLGTVRDYVDRLASLTPPRADQAEWGRMLRISARQENILAAEIRAGQIGDVALAKEINDSLKPFNHRSDAIARHLGLTQCIGAGSESDETEPSRSERPGFN